MQVLAEQLADQGVPVFLADIKGDVSGMAAPGDASKPFLEPITQTVRLIRSKGVGVFFVTQTPKDVHLDVLAQLGNRVQHALRAYTPDDAKALKATASTFPKSGYDLEEVLTELGTGEAIVTLYPKYKDVVDRESASEMLAARMAKEEEPAAPAMPPAKKTRASTPKPEKGLAEQILGSRTTKSVLTASATQLIRSVFGTRKR